MKFIQSKLYKCLEYYLLVYPTVEKAVAARVPAHHGTIASTTPGHWADYWSKRLDCQVRYSNPEDPMLFMEETKIGQERFLRFLLPGFEGWIVWRDWLEFEEVKP